MSVEESWQRIAAWAAENMPEGEFQPAPGATDEQIRELETRLGFDLPADVRASYRVHNGTEGFSGFPYRSHDLLPLHRVGEVYVMHRQLQVAGQSVGPPEVLTGPIKPQWWSARRVPLTDSGAGDGLHIDLEPAPGGVVGQVVDFSHELGPTRVVASSWAALLEQIVADCDAGVFYYDEDEEQPWARHYDDEG